MKILILISSLSGGGAERVAVRLANALAEDHKVYIMPFSKSGKTFPIDPRIQVVDHTLYDLRQGGGFLNRTFRKVRTAVHMYGVLKRFRSRVRVDTSLSLLLTPNIYNVSVRGGGRRILCERNNPTVKGFWFFFVTKLVYRRGDVIVFQSETVQKMFSAKVRRKSVILPNPVAVSCRASGTPEKAIVTAGRLKVQKDHETLIRAFAVFHETHPDWRLKLYGKGPLKEKLISLSEELGVGKAVRFMGYRDDLHERISSAGMLVLSSRFEGQPNVLLEAMMIGLPCVTTDFLGVRELLGDSGSALIVPVGDRQAMADAMGRVADEPALRRELVGKAGTFVKKFEADKVIQQWKGVLFPEEHIPEQ